MLKKLRLKFVLVAMLATALVLVGIIGGINVHNYLRVDRNAGEMLELLAREGGKFPDRPTRPEEDHTAPAGQGTPPVGGHENLSPEAPFETRYFTVTLDAAGNVTATDTGNIAAVDATTAATYAQDLFRAGRASGFVGNYKYLATGKDDGTQYIFLDCSRDLDNARAFLRASCFVSLAGFAIVTALIVLLSGAVMKPVAETYQKQRRFITDANHELKTPLTVIDADCEILEYNGIRNEWTAGIREQVARLTELTNELVILSRMDEEEHATLMSEFSLSEVVREGIRPYLTLCEAEHKSLDVQIAPDVSCTGDMKMIGRLVALLMDNAVKYSDAPGNIVLTLTGGKNPCLTVRNTTDGVPAGNLDCLFERFYRLDHSRNSETGGHGIGLSVAQAIVRQHKGKIHAGSPDGKTVIFTVFLPA